MHEINHTPRPLANRLADKLRRDGGTVKTVAQRLGISQSYLAQLLGGDRDFAATDIEVLRKAAEYLNLPPIICFLLAGKICNADFYESRMELDTQVDRVLPMVAESPSSLEVAVDATELHTLPAKAKLLLVLLYQMTLGTELVPGRKRWPWTSETDASPFKPLFRQE